MGSSNGLPTDERQRAHARHEALRQLGHHFLFRNDPRHRRARLFLGRIERLIVAEALNGEPKTPDHEVLMALERLRTSLFDDAGASKNALKLAEKLVARNGALPVEAS